MTCSEAIELMKKKWKCVEADVCIHDCDSCMLSSGKASMLEALDMGMEALRWKMEQEDDRK